MCDIGVGSHDGARFDFHSSLISNKELNLPFKKLYIPGKQIKIIYIGLNL